MKVKVLFERLRKTESVRFIKAIARKDAYTPFYHAEYQTTPTRTVEDWSNSSLMEYIILNDNQPQIEWLSGAYDRSIKNMLIISEDDLAMIYKNEQQRNSIVETIERRIK